MGRIVRYTLAGMLGALIAWALVNPFIPNRVATLSYWLTLYIGVVSGGLVGLLLGVADALGAASRREAYRSMAICAAVGAVGGVFGLNIGNIVFNAALQAAGGAAIYGGANDVNVAPSPLQFTLLLLGRGFGWALVGASIGLAHGIAKRAPQKMINGAVGGFIGGLIGGSAFETLVWISRGGLLPLPAGMMGSIPSVVRFTAYAITGGAIGLFIGFIDEVTKKAWLIKLIGRNEGKEILLYKLTTTLGRDEYADIPIYGDPDVAPKHAVITAVGQRHFIQDVGSTYGTFLNSNKITQREPLQDGDLLLIGKTKFTFRDKATARSGAPRSAPSQVQIPTSSHVCQFCGAIRDAQGNCDCTVGAQPPQQTVNLGQPTQQLDQQQRQLTQSIDGSLPSTINPQCSTATKLIGISGPYQGHTFLIDSVMQIGREATKDIALPMDNAVSRNHATISCQNGVCVIQDTGSTNGTHVNGVRITQQQLNNTDMVQIGSTKFRFEG